MVSRNNLKSLPTQIGQMKAIATFNAEDNKLESLPSQIARLSSLTDFRINNNQLTRLPTELSQMTNVRRFQVEGNRLVGVPFPFENHTPAAFCSAQKATSSETNCFATCVPQCCESDVRCLTTTRAVSTLSQTISFSTSSPNPQISTSIFEQDSENFFNTESESGKDNNIMNPLASDSPQQQLMGDSSNTVLIGVLVGLVVAAIGIAIVVAIVFKKRKGATETLDHSIKENSSSEMTINNQYDAVPPLHTYDSCNSQEKGIGQYDAAPPLQYDSY